MYLSTKSILKLLIYLFSEVKEEIVKLLRMYKRDFPDKCLSLSLSEDLIKLFGEL